jgi:coenzyme Q-binding protein COQ10
MRTWNARELAPGVDSVDAEARVGFSFLKERFSTRVTRDAGKRQIDVGLLVGPFRRLENRWCFEDDGSGGTLVVFDIDFQFKSRLLEALLAANFGHAVERLMACFEARAETVYGKTAAPDAA